MVTDDSEAFKLDNLESTNLQTMAYHLNLIARKYKMTNPAQKLNQWQCGGTTFRV